MRIITAAAACLALAACDTPNFRTSQFQFGDAKTLAATGNLRFVTERDRILPRNTAHVVCSEPSPDYAVGSGTNANGTIKAVSPSPISELGGAVVTSEQVTQLDGREKGVLALRDGLYAACQAYVNGLIGKDAYSLILSQYGLLLVALMEPAPSITVTGDAAKKPPTWVTARAKPASSFAALLVACINDRDSTRRDYSVDEVRGAPSRFPDGYDHNILLSKKVCDTVMWRAASGKAD